MTVPGGGRSRDRDGAGRPRSGRPRDATGRPLPRDAGGSPQLSDSEVAQLAADPRRALAEARRLAEAGRPFAAHEVLEARWKSAPEEERLLWRSLAQLAVGLTHLQRGNVRGARALLGRSADGLAEVGRAEPAAPPGSVASADIAGTAGLDVAGVSAWAAALAAALEDDPSGG